MEAAADLSAAALALQVDLLQLPPEIPAPGAPALRGVLDCLFAHWLSLPDTVALVNCLVQKAKASGGGGPGIAGAAMLPSMMLQGGASVPPLSPRSPHRARRPSGVGAGQPKTHLGFLDVPPPPRAPSEATVARVRRGRRCSTSVVANARQARWAPEASRVPGGAAAAARAKRGGPPGLLGFLEVSPSPRAPSEATVARVRRGRRCSTSVPTAVEWRWWPRASSREHRGNAWSWWRGPLRGGGRRRRSSGRLRSRGSPLPARCPEILPARAASPSPSPSSLRTLSQPAQPPGGHERNHHQSLTRHPRRAQWLLPSAPRFPSPPPSAAPAPSSSSSSVSSAPKPRFVACRSESTSIQQLARPLGEYMSLPASQYSVLDAERIERVDESTFRCYVYRF